jgi:hypothetical protein
MLDVAQHGFHFDAALHPSNVMDYTFCSFVHQVKPRALKEGIGVQTMKPLGGKCVCRDHRLRQAGDTGTSFECREDFQVTY